jgi:primosomal protein N' (replication factor Y)
VGVVFADSTLFHTDYRSSERTFQLLTQVAGRAGRAEKEGCVVIQTNAPHHRAIELCTKHDYKSFFKLEIGDRMRTLFPPFSVFIRAMFVSENEQTAAESAGRYAEGITEKLFAVLEKDKAEKELVYVMPGAAPIRRREGEYRYAVIIKLARTVHTAGAIASVYEFSDTFNDDCFRGVEINPQEML